MVVTITASTKPVVSCAARAVSYTHLDVYKRQPPRQDKSDQNENSPRRRKNDENEDPLPDDVWRYSEKHKTFPHQSTADQWFDELQFESYRALGEHIGRTAAAEIGPAINRALG